MSLVLVVSCIAAGQVQLKAGQVQVLTPEQRFSKLFGMLNGLTVFTCWSSLIVLYAVFSDDLQELECKRGHF